MASAGTAQLACAPDLRSDHPFDGELDRGPRFAVVASASGVREATVDASSSTGLVYLDLDRDVELGVGDALATSAWELAFRRFEIVMNGGSSNPTGAVRAAVLSGTTFEAVGPEVAAVARFEADGAEPFFNSAEGGWYVYDFGAHRLRARGDLLYLVRTGEGATLKLRLLDYYSAEGTPAIIRFDYARLP